MEEALHDIPMLRRFAGLDAGESRMPDETTILNFCHLLEAHQLAESLFQEVVSRLTDQGLILREGTIVDATLIAAPPSTKNEARQRDPEMTSSKKGNQGHFGMKAHIGADTVHGLVHTLEVTTGEVSDYSTATNKPRTAIAATPTKRASPTVCATRTRLARAGLCPSSLRRGATQRLSRTG